MEIKNLTHYDVTHIIVYFRNWFSLFQSSANETFFSTKSSVSF